MAFLGKLATTGARFLAGASKAGRFLSSNVGNIQKASRQLSSFANNASVQKVGQQLGIKPSAFQQVGSVANAVAGNLPGVQQAANTAITDTRRNIGTLYNAVNRRPA
jgi:hypothetical protein